MARRSAGGVPQLPPGLAPGPGRSPGVRRPWVRRPVGASPRGTPVPWARLPWVRRPVGTPAPGACRPVGTSAPGRAVPWARCLLGTSSRGRAVPWVRRPGGTPSRGRAVPWARRPGACQLPEPAGSWTRAGPWAAGTRAAGPRVPGRLGRWLRRRLRRRLRPGVGPAAGSGRFGASELSGRRGPGAGPAPRFAGRFGVRAFRAVRALRGAWLARRGLRLPGLRAVGFGPRCAQPRVPGRRGPGPSRPWAVGSGGAANPGSLRSAERCGLQAVGARRGIWPAPQPMARAPRRTAHGPPGCRNPRAAGIPGLPESPGCRNPWAAGLLRPSVGAPRPPGPPRTACAPPVAPARPRGARPPAALRSGARHR